MHTLTDIQRWLYIYIMFLVSTFFQVILLDEITRHTCFLRIKKSKFKYRNTVVSDKTILFKTKCMFPEVFSAHIKWFCSFLKHVVYFFLFRTVFA